MELSPKQQIVELISQAKKILVLTHMNPDGDALGSILALRQAFIKLGKEVTAVCADSAPNVFKFLPNLGELKQELLGNKDFIISLDTTGIKVDRLGYKNHPEENKLNIVITPSSGNFSKENISIDYGKVKYDLIFILDAPDLERLGALYDENTELFYEVPIVNIDHHPGNDYFGKVNWVDLTATSTAEILVALLESLGREKSLIDPDIATCLLTGIITDTGSFQHSNTTPKAFTVAAQLVAAGGKQQEIVHNVYKTKSLSTLKLWGKILSNIKEEKKYNFVYSTVSASDFRQFSADESETQGVVDELLKTAPDIDFALLLSEKKNGIHGSLRGVEQGNNVAQIAKAFGGGGHELAAAFFMIGKTLPDSKDEIIEKIKDLQIKHLRSTQLSNETEKQLSSDNQISELPRK